MSKTRYKIRKQQLERVVESFVTESASPEAKKNEQGYNDKEDESLGVRTGKESTKKQSDKARREDSYGKWGKRSKHAAEAKKHKIAMGAEQSNDMGKGMKQASKSTSSKMKHAPEAKKYVKGSVSESQQINETDPITVGAGIAALFAAAGGAAALEGYIDKLQKKDPNHKLVKMLKGLRAMGKEAGKARRHENTSGRQINEDPVTIGAGIAGLIAAAGGAAALEGYSAELKKKKPNHPLVKVFNMLQSLGKSSKDARDHRGY